MLLLASLVLPPVLALGLLYWFWRLARRPGANPDAPPRRAAWVGLTTLAVVIGLVLYGWLLYLTRFIDLGHAASPTSFWRYEQLHQQILLSVGMIGLVFTLLLAARPPHRLWPALSFGGGILLVLAAAGSIWYVTRNKERQQGLAQFAFRDHEGTGWQSAVVDSFRKREFHDHLGEAGFMRRNPAFPGGEQALAQAVRQRVRWPAKVEENREGVVSVEFIVETDGRLVLPHVRFGMGAGYDEEAVRVVRSLPRFIPGMRYEELTPAIWHVEVPFQR